MEREREHMAKAGVLAIFTLVFPSRRIYNLNAASSEIPSDLLRGQMMITDEKSTSNLCKNKTAYPIDDDSLPRPIMCKCHSKLMYLNRLAYGRLGSTSDPVRLECTRMGDA